MKLTDEDVAAKKCLHCKFAAYDPDGVYCASQPSLDASLGFGRSLHYARTTVCNDKLWEAATSTQLKARGYK